MSGSIIHAQAGQAALHKTTGDAAASSAGSGDQAWRREIERAQACAWFSMPAVGGGGEGLGHASRPPSRPAGANPRPAAAPRDSSAERVRPPHQHSRRTEAATALPQRHDSRLAVSAEASPVAAADVDAPANLLQSTQQPTSRSVFARIDHAVDQALPTPMAATTWHTINAPAALAPSGPATRSALPARPQQTDNTCASPEQAATPSHQPGVASADDRNPVRLSLALQGKVARVWLGIDEHVRPHLSQIVSSTIKDLNAQGITVDHLVCNGEVITGPGISPGRRKSTERPPHLSHLDQGEP
jgi:hypothetical protein